ncbi:YihY/virulence factor BrkB family protein [bacterium]|nr:YihY/virulence factor BrkB family protein [bacterium]
MSRKTTFFERAMLQASLYERAHRFLSKTIWQIDLKRLPTRWQRTGLLALRVLYLGGRGLMSSRTQLQASSLTYTTMLALVPAFAIVFSIFQGFGGLDQTASRVKQFVVEAIAANPEQAATISEKMEELVRGAQKHVNSGSGIAGAALVLLIYTIVSLLSSVEATLNNVWEVKRSRSFIQKFMTYWAVATLGPILLGVALLAGSQLAAYRPTKILDRFRTSKNVEKEKAKEAEKEQPAKETEPDDEFRFQGVGGAIAERHLRLAKHGSEAIQTPEDEARYLLLGTLPTPEQEEEERGFRLTSFFLTVVFFFVLYAFMPNTKVQLKPALIGGLIAATAWQTSKWALARSSTSLVQYNTIYGGLATIPILMFWLYITWLIVIVGAELTFAIQNSGSQGREELAEQASPRCREVVALRVMATIARAFSRGATPPVLSVLAKEIGAPLTLVSTVVFRLCEDGLLREVEEASSAEESRGYVPARPLSQITLAEIGKSLHERQGINFSLEGGLEASYLEEQLGLAESARDGIGGRITLETIVAGLAERSRAPAPVPGPSVPTNGGAPSSPSTTEVGGSA